MNEKKELTYLGIIMSSDGYPDSDILRRLNKGISAGNEIIGMLNENSFLSYFNTAMTFRILFWRMDFFPALRQLIFFTSHFTVFREIWHLSKVKTILARFLLLDIIFFLLQGNRITFLALCLDGQVYYVPFSNSDFWKRKTIRN